MSTINLIIGSVDVSENVETESYSVHKVWKTSTEFTRVDGSVITRRRGFFYELSVNLNGVHESIMHELISALDSDSIPITFSDPHSYGCTSVSFERGESTGGEISEELDDGLYWNLNTSLKSEFIPRGRGL